MTIQNSTRPRVRWDAAAARSEARRPGLGAWLRWAMGLMRGWREEKRSRRQQRILCELDDQNYRGKAELALPPFGFALVAIPDIQV
jgi:hypothetical protein